MVTKRYSRADFEAERERGKALGIQTPEAGENGEFEYKGVKIGIETKIEDNGDVTAYTKIITHPWYEPEGMIEKAIRDNV